MPSFTDLAGFDLGVGKLGRASGGGTNFALGVRDANIISLHASYEHSPFHNGGSAEIGFWLPISLHPHSPHAHLALIPEAMVGRLWGGPFKGYGSLGLGAGWAIVHGGRPVLPFVEFRRRLPFRGLRFGDNMIVVGLLFAIPDV